MKSQFRFKFLCLFAICVPLDCLAMDLISSTTCSAQSGKLVWCKITAQTFSTESVETAVPLRTVVTVKRTGNCSNISHPLTVSLKPDVGPAVTLSYISVNVTKALVYHPEKLPLNSLTISDSSQWTGQTLFYGSCRISLDIAFNQLDFDTKQEARTYLADLNKQLADRKKERDMYKDLVDYAEAFGFLNEIAKNLYTELSNDMMQKLRTTAVDAQPILQTLLEDHKDEYDDATRTLLGDFLTDLCALGDPELWLKPDGKVKTLAEFMTDLAQDQEKAKLAWAAVDRLSANYSEQKLAEYKQAFEAKALEVTQLEAKVALADHQLSGFLSY